MKKIIKLTLFLSIGLSAWGQTGLQITGGKMKVTGSVSLVLKDAKLVNNAAFVATAGEVLFTGTAASANSGIQGSAASTLYDLTINKSSNDVTLSQNATISNTLDFQSGNLDIQNFDLTISSGGGITNGTSTKYVKTSGSGSLIQQVAGTDVTFPVGNSAYNPAILNNSGTSDNFDVRVTDEVLTNGTSGTALTADVVDRTWLIGEETGGGSNLTITTTWNGSEELTGFTRAACYISHYTGSGWNANSAAAASGSDPYTISRAGITSLSPFAVGSGGALPIELLDFYARQDGDKVALKWLTAAELNNNGFEVQWTSSQGIGNGQWERLGFVASLGDSFDEQSYAFLHENPIQGTNYYRIKQIDHGGAYEYSGVVSVDLTNLKGLTNLRLVPNPVYNGQFTLYLPTTEEAQLPIRLYDAVGRLVSEQFVSGTEATVEVYDLPIGVYLLTVDINSKRMVERVVVVNNE